MPLDPRAQAFLDQIASAGGLPAPGTISVEDERKNLDLFCKSMLSPPEPVAKVVDCLAPGPAGQIPVRIYTPQGSEAFPVLVDFHGGGFVLGSVEMDDPGCRMLANAAACIVVSVEYRLAPEHKFPAAVEDCYAAVVALMARDRGTPRLVYQLLMYPVTNFASDTPSMRENAEGYMLTRDGIARYWNLYLGSEADGYDPYASPLRARDLRGLPAALVVTAEYDPLRDEGEAYAARLHDAGVSAVCMRYDGMLHGGLPFDMGKEAMQEAAAALRSALAKLNSW
jgi:acetyl esterase